MTDEPADTAPVIVTGGGTAGHVLPAIAVAEALVANGRDPAAVHYVGCRRGVETELIPPTGLSHDFYDVVGLQRSLTKRNLAVVPKLWSATRAAIRAQRRRRPAAVVSVGGYASLPAVFAARRLGVPVVVVSFDHTPGLASRLAARFAAASAVAFDDSPLPRAVVTGAPVRQAILDVDRAGGRHEARRRLGVPDDRFLVVVVGGSQGSKALNDAIGGFVRDHRSDDELAVYHIAGKRFIDQAAGDSAAVGSDDAGADGPGDGVWYRAVGYVDDMASLYAAADLLIGRGGASTVHEVAVTGTPAVLVPWPDAAEDHQRQNVAWLADAGGAILLDESEISSLPTLIDRLRSDPERRADLAAAARSLGERQRSGLLADVIEGVAEVPPRG